MDLRMTSTHTPAVVNMCVEKGAGKDKQRKETEEKDSASTRNGAAATQLDSPPPTTQATIADQEMGEAGADSWRGEERVSSEPELRSNANKGGGGYGGGLWAAATLGKTAR